MNIPKNTLMSAITIALVVLIAMFFIKTLGLAYPITVNTSYTTNELSITGEGKVDVIPDTAYVDVGITVDNATTVDEAQSKINEINNKIDISMKQLGIDKKDIKTSNYSISPNYIYDNNQNRVSGYNGNVTISIKVRDMNKTSQVIDEATKAGANQVQGANYTVEQPEKYREEARSKAIANAKEQAQKLANDLGIKLGKITNIVESAGADGYYPQAPVMMDKAAGMGGGQAANIEPGSQTITSVVTLYFEKK